MYFTARYFNHNFDQSQAMTLKPCNNVASPEKPAVSHTMPTQITTI